MRDASAPTPSAMEAFLAEQSDFILFFYGLAFVLLGITCLALRRRATRGRSWAVLGAFGLVHGASEWLDLTALVIGDSVAFAAMRTAVMAVSYVLLVEFVRRELRQQGYWVPGAWIYVPVLALIGLAGATQGPSEANAIARYALGLVGAWGASWVFVLYARDFAGAMRLLAVTAAVAFACYGVAAGLIVPAAPFWPADAVNQERLLEATGVPIQLVRGLLACAVAAAIWGIWGQKLIREVSSARYARFLRKQFIATIAVMLAILVSGWGLTEYFGILHKHQLKEETRGDLDLLASSLAGLTAPLDAVVQSLAGAPTVRAALSGETRARQELPSLLSLDVGASRAQGGLVRDASGAVIAFSGRADGTGMPRRTAPYVQGTLSGKPDRRLAFDPASGQTMYATSFPVHDAAGALLGTAELTLSLVDFETRLEAFTEPFFLVDPRGIITLSNRSELVGRAIWPRVGNTAQPERRTAPRSAPVLEREIGDSTWTTVDGEPTYVRRCPVVQSGWSLVIFVPVEGIFASRVLGIAITLLATIMVLIYVVARERAVHDHVQMDRRLELEELARILDHKATTDPLTGLSNRLKFDEALAKEILRARRFGTPLALILYDVDHFKQVNDNYGHQVGDEVLIKLSRFVAERTRATDLLARWGGEEFAILVPHADGDMAAKFAALLRAGIEATSFGQAGAMTCSFGVAELAVGESAESLVQRADAALYRAKVSGRNRVELAGAPSADHKGVGSAA